MAIIIHARAILMAGSMTAVGHAHIICSQRSGAPLMALSRDEQILAIHEDTLSAYLDTQRDLLVGAVDSHALLEADNQHDMLPLACQRDPNAAQMVFVDEANCIGCRSCAEVARSTFRMEDDFGAARAFQQFGNEAEVIEEAIACCPVDCIHQISFNELRALERHRQSMIDRGEMAAVQGAGKLAARAEGRASAASWRSPLRGVSFSSGGLDAPARGDDGATAEAVAEAAGAAGAVAYTADAVDILEEEARDVDPAHELSWDVIASLYPPEESN